MKCEKGCQPSCLMRHPTTGACCNVYRQRCDECRCPLSLNEGRAGRVCEACRPFVLAARRQRTERLVEASAASFGLVGAALLASHHELAAWGWLAFLASNCGWLLYAALGGHRFLLLQQVGFTATSLVGIWRWLL